MIARPYCSPDTTGPKYEQYCRQSLTKHKPFHQITDLLAGCETYAAAYATFLHSGNYVCTSYCHSLRIHAAACYGSLSHKHDDYSTLDSKAVKCACSTLVISPANAVSHKDSIRHYSHLESANSSFLTFLSVFRLSVGAKRRYTGDK